VKLLFVFFETAEAVTKGQAAEESSHHRHLWRLRFGWLFQKREREGAARLSASWRRCHARANQSTDLAC
jgi:hypothetical protein